MEKNDIIIISLIWLISIYTQFGVPKTYTISIEIFAENAILISIMTDWFALPTVLHDFIHTHTCVPPLHTFTLLFLFPWSLILYLGQNELKI